APVRQNAGALADTQDIQDEGHASIAHDGGSGIYGQPLELFAERLDYDFLGVADAVDDQAELAILSLENDNIDGVGFGVLQVQRVVQISDGQQPSAPAV